MKDLLRFFFSKEFLKQLIYVAVFMLLVVMAVLLWLNNYTNHGQKLTLPDYTNMNIDEAVSDADSKSFTILISDSSHIVGKPGGIILDQNPIPGSKVKENRKIYVTTTKFSPDNILVKDLPLLYGTDYEQAISDLKSRSIFSEIKSRKYDAGQPNHILEVWYNGSLIISKDQIKSAIKIEKGATLQFVVSQRQGGSFLIPDLVCRTLAEAKSYMLYSKLKLGSIGNLNDTISSNDVWVVAQTPMASTGAEAEAGTTINIQLSTTKPAKCQ